MPIDGRAGECACDVAKRLIDPGIPYVVWSVIYTLLAIRRGRHIDFPTFLRLLATGKAWDHLYFIVLIFQFYLLFPPVVEGFAIFELQARFMAGHRGGAYSGRGSTCGINGYLPYPTGRVGRRGSDSTCSPGCLRVSISMSCRIGRGEIGGQLRQCGR